MALFPALRRGRLLDELSSAELRVIRFVAPAGYGKSTMARALLEGRSRVAIADVARVANELDAVREIVESVLRMLEEPSRARYARQSVAFGSDVAGWLQLAADVLNLLDGATLLIENAEALANEPAVVKMIGGLLARLPGSATLIVCSRVELDLRLARFAGPDRTRVVSADDLRFDRAEIAKVFSGVALRGDQLREVERFTRGWPIVVMMLFALARRGRLDAYLTGTADVADLYGYLASEVFGTLAGAERDVLEALAAIPDATERDLQTLFGRGNYEGALERLSRDTPFVTSNDRGQIEVHPAMRQMLADRVDFDHWRSVLYETVDRGDGGLRAANIALLRGCPDDAARAVVDLAQPMLLSTPTPEFDVLLGALPDETLIRYPMLWNAAMLTRASRDTVGVMRDGERIAAGFTPETPVPVVLGVLNVLAQVYANRGHFDRVRRIADRLRTEPQLIGNPIGEMLSSFWLFLIAAYAGDPVDLSRIGTEFAVLTADPATGAFMECIVLAAHHRLHGDRWAETAALERSREIAQTSELPLVHAICNQHSAFGAWFWGEQRQFDRYLAELERQVDASIANQFFVIINAARGKPHDARHGSEAHGDRALAYLIGAAATKSSPERSRLIDDALTAASQSGRRFPRILCHVAQALCHPSSRNKALREAAILAEQTESVALVSAIRALREEDGGDLGMLTAFAARFAIAADVEMAGVLIDLNRGEVRRGAESINLSGRELELLVYLALEGQVVRPDDIIRVLWPNVAPERARATLRVNITRIRKRFSDPQIIVIVAGGYRLGVPVEVVGARSFANRIAP